MTPSQPLTNFSGTFDGIQVERTSLDLAVAEFVREVTSVAPARAHRLVNSYTFALADTNPTYTGYWRIRG